MIIAWTDIAWDDYLYWQAEDKKVLKRINRLIKNISRSPYEGIGDPEPLKHDKSGYWSRRINKEHRIVYKEIPDGVVIVQRQFHY